MIITQRISLLRLLKGSGRNILWLFLYTGTIALLYNYNIINVIIPWLPVSVVGTAVAFYVGFKNSQAYDRMWEARKIWGGIVNESRTWGMMIDGYITNLFADKKISLDELYNIKKRLIYRHIAWIYAHRAQLLIPTSWEHISQGGSTAKTAKMYQTKYGIGLIEDEKPRAEIKQFLRAEEFERVICKSNTATQIINEQSRDLTMLREQGLIDDFRHMELENILKGFYTLQGQNERIKKFPLPRQYANMSRYFVGIFLILLPFSMMPELMKINEIGVWISIPITTLIGWVYVMMEVVGDYSENPFQGMANDIPMMSLCRSIEIDLKEMLEETDIPQQLTAKDGILM